MLVNLIRALAAVIIISFFVIFWELSRGPLSLSFIMPYIVTFLNDYEGKFSFKVEKGEIEWEGWKSPVVLKLTGLTVDSADAS